MYRLLIVDDENFVVDSLSTMFETRQESELDVCRAYSATEALGWLYRAKIDIIITDIKMQDMSGVELAKKVNLNWPQCKIIFLTAYAEFDYAYEAIRNNVIGYILKAENEKRIIAEVDKAVAILDREMKNYELLEQVQDHLDNSLSVIRKEIILNILKGNHDNLPELFTQLNGVGSSISAGKPFVLFIGRIENGKYGSQDLLERFRQFSSVQKTLEQYFSKYYHMECMEYDPQKIACIMQMIDSGADEAIEIAAIAEHESVFVAGMLETVQKTCMDTSNIYISFALHGNQLDTKQLSEAFQSLNCLMKLHVSESTGFIITSPAPAPTEEEKTPLGVLHPGKQAISNIIEKMKNYLENNNRDNYMAEFDKLCGLLGGFTNWNSNSAWEIYYSIAGSMTSYMNQRDLVEKITPSIGFGVLHNPRSVVSWSDVSDYLKRLSGFIFDLQKTEQQESSGNIVRFLKEYIETHITEDVSLIKLSEVSGYNAIYLTRVFKKNTGETINDYICKQKLSIIKKLMYDKSLSIGDISDKAGFEYRSYFNKFIRKATGMSPQEFRKYVTVD